MVKKIAKKAAKKVSTKKKAGYSCKVCGLAVTVDNICGCVDVCDIICCGQEMQLKKR